MRRLDALQDELESAVREKSESDARLSELDSLVAQVREYTDQPHVLLHVAHVEMLRRLCYFERIQAGAIYWPICEV